MFYMAEIEIKLTGKIDGVNIDAITGTPQITFSVNERNNLLQGYDALKNCNMLTITATPYRKKRSINANAYAWKLITEIADVLRASKESIYLMMLRHYGQSEIISIISDVRIENFVKYYDEEGESILKGKRFKHYRVYKGSSEFDTREMSILIDGIVEEAKALNIPTEPPEEIERLKSLWKEE